MSFKQLYDAVSNITTAPIVIDKHIVPVVKGLTAQDEIYFIPVELDTGISLGHIKQYRDIPSVPYGESKWITEIRWHDELNMCWRRFVCCKELMHTFDNEAERTNSRAKYFGLMDELESQPLRQDWSAMLESENRTKWMALAVLCPLPLREQLRAEWAAGKLSDYEAALRLRVPEVVIKNVMHDYFLEVIDDLTAG